MEYLVDTQILLWSFFEPSRLPKGLSAILSGDADVFYSPVSLWEIAIKYGIGKLDLGGHAPEEFFDLLDESPFICQELLNGSLVTSYRLPLYHRDPFDRMLVWEALQHDLTLMTADKTLAIYQPEGLRLAG